MEFEAASTAVTSRTTGVFASLLSGDFGRLAEQVGELLLMGVDPGFGGQAFIEAVAPKIGAARRLITAHHSRAKINIDGGVKPDNARRLADAGADYLVVGSALFGDAGISACAGRLRAALMGG
ncbi:MAG: hypothetical protein GIX01_08525 [Candidatus Eremiobacteraeota bacterium]|nr:hypothetical protein [Candidatus Eremiobacteraeota bacterium]